MKKDNLAKKILIDTFNHHGVHFRINEKDPLKSYIKDNYVAFVAIECAMEEYAKEEIMNFLQTVKGSDMMYKTREELLDIYLKGK